MIVKTPAEKRQQNSEAARRWRARNPEKVRETRRRWYDQNREKIRESGRRRRAENAEKFRESQRRWYVENREKILEAQRHRAAYARYQKARDKKQGEAKLNATAHAYRVIFRDRLMAQAHAHARDAAKKQVS